MLEQVHDVLWVVEGEMVSFFGLPYPTRSVIARLANGDLWVWSPVKLTPDLRNEVDSLGSVRHLVSPNKLHHLYLQEWKAAYPEAQLWGPQTTIKKRPDIKFQEALADSPPIEWLADIDQAWFRGSLRHGRDCLSSPPLRYCDCRRFDPDVQRSFSPTTLGLVALLGAPRWPHPGQGLRAARMAIIVYQSRTGASGARQSAELELPTRHCCPRRVVSRERQSLSCKFFSLAWHLICRPARISRICNDFRFGSDIVL